MNVFHFFTESTSSLLEHKAGGSSSQSSVYTATSYVISIWDLDTKGRIPKIFCSASILSSSLLITPPVNGLSLYQALESSKKQRIDFTYAIRIQTITHPETCNPLDLDRVKLPSGDYQRNKVFHNFAILIVSHKIQLNY